MTFYSPDVGELNQGGSSVAGGDYFVGAPLFPDNDCFTINTGNYSAVSVDYLEDGKVVVARRSSTGIIQIGMVSKLNEPTPLEGTFTQVAAAGVTAEMMSVVALSPTTAALVYCSNANAIKVAYVTNLDTTPVIAQAHTPAVSSGAVYQIFAKKQSATGVYFFITDENNGVNFGRMTALNTGTIVLSNPSSYGISARLDCVCMLDVDTAIATFGDVPAGSSGTRLIYFTTLNSVSPTLQGQHGMSVDFGNDHYYITTAVKVDVNNFIVYGASKNNPPSTFRVDRMGYNTAFVPVNRKQVPLWREPRRFALVDTDNVAISMRGKGVAAINVGSAGGRVFGAAALNPKELPADTSPTLANETVVANTAQNNQDIAKVAKNLAVLFICDNADSGKLKLTRYK